MSRRLIDEISCGNVFERTEALSGWATSPDPASRRTIAEALATGAGDLGALTAVQHLARDSEKDVRATAVAAAAVRMETAPGRYGAIARAACSDESRAVRRVAIAATRKLIELGHVRGVARALTRCTRIRDPITQDLALDALRDLSRLTPRRTLDALADIADHEDVLDLSVRPRLRERIRSLRRHHPRRVEKLLRRLSDAPTSLVPQT